MIAGKMRHIVDVMRPPEPQGEGGQLNSQPKVLMKDVPCSIENLSGIEQERMQQMYATARNKVRMYGDPDNPLRTVDWLVDQSGKRLNILQINDKWRNGIELEMICGEEVA